MGTGVSGSCPDCDCAAGGTCGGTVTYYENGNCGGGGGAYTATIDGNCDLTPGLYVDMPVAAYTWNPTVVPTCSSTPRAPTLALTGEVTVCCP